MSTAHHAYLYWLATHIGPAYEFCCPCGICESVLYRYGLHRADMLFDRVIGKTRSHVSGFLKIRKPYQSLQTTVMYCSALFRIPIRILILIFNRTNVCPPLISKLILIVSAKTLLNEVSLIFS
jgi:hypothetical protein